MIRPMFASLDLEPEASRRLQLHQSARIRIPQSRGEMPPLSDYRPLSVQASYRNIHPLLFALVPQET
jgi:hypothetical protein